MSSSIDRLTPNERLLASVLVKGLSFNKIRKKFKNPSLFEWMYKGVLYKFQFSDLELFLNSIKKYRDIADQKNSYILNQEYHLAVPLRQEILQKFPEYEALDKGLNIKLSDLYDYFFNNIDEHEVGNEIILSPEYDYNQNNDADEELNIYIDPGTATPDQIGQLLNEISTLYQMLGGTGISFKPDEIRTSNFAL